MVKHRGQTVANDTVKTIITNCILNITIMTRAQKEAQLIAQNFNGNFSDSDWDCSCSGNSAPVPSSIPIVRFNTPVPSSIPIVRVNTVVPSPTTIVRDNPLLAVPRTTTVVPSPTTIVRDNPLLAVPRTTTLVPRSSTIVRDNPLIAVPRTTTVVAPRSQQSVITETVREIPVVVINTPTNNPDTTIAEQITENLNSNPLTEPIYSGLPNGNPSNEFISEPILPINSDFISQNGEPGSDTLENIDTPESNKAGVWILGLVLSGLAYRQFRKRGAKTSK
jgi:hypothetical protein